MKYYIISGEASGDLHGGNLIRALLRRDPNAQIRYWGGDRMAEAAAEFPQNTIVQVRHIRDLAYMGIVEVAAHLGTVLGNISFCKRDIMAFKPDVMVFIDYPGFNLKIAKFTHQKGLRNVYYISPQIWAWKKGRLRPMRRDLDKLCYILPSEKHFYAHNIMPQALFVGHPLLDEVARYKVALSLNAVGASHSWQRKIALLPGSRKHELQKMLPLMTALAARHPELQFEIAGMSLIGIDFYQRYIPADIKNIAISMDRTYGLLGESWAAVVCSGTATLETALFDVPQVVCYQANKISAAIARVLIGNHIKYISLVNLIADAPVVKELIQGDCNLDNIDRELQAIVTDGPRRQSILNGYATVHHLLGGVGASDRVAKTIIDN